MSDDEFNDPFEQSGPTGPPYLSWKKSDPGDNDTFVGIVMAVDHDADPNKGYRTIQEMGREKQADGSDGPLALMFWPPDGVDSRRPVSLAKYTSLNKGSAEGATRVPKTEIFLTSDLTNFKFASLEARQKAEEAGVTDQGDRRMPFGGKDLKPKIQAALKKIGVKRVEVGQEITVKLTERRKNTGKEGSTSIYDVVIKEPTAETRAKADAAGRRVAQARNESEFGDPWGGGGGSSSSGSHEEDPPF